jgi:hypothetical protein
MMAKKTVQPRTGRHYSRGDVKEMIQKHYLPIPPDLPVYYRKQVEEGRKQAIEEAKALGISDELLDSLMQPPTPYHQFRDFAACVAYKNWAKEHGLDLEMIGFSASKLQSCLFELRPDTVEGLGVASWRDIDFRYPLANKDEWFVPYEPYTHPEE